MSCNVDNLLEQQVHRIYIYNGNHFGVNTNSFTHYSLEADPGHLYGAESSCRDLVHGARWIRGSRSGGGSEDPHPPRCAGFCARTRVEPQSHCERYVRSVIFVCFKFCNVFVVKCLLTIYCWYELGLQLGSVCVCVRACVRACIHFFFLSWILLLSNFYIRSIHKLRRSVHGLCSVLASMQKANVLEKVMLYTVLYLNPFLIEVCLDWNMGMLTDWNLGLS